MQVAFSIANIAWMITVALGSASTILVSHIVGAEQREELRPMVNATYHLGICWAAFMAIIFLLFRTPMAALFTDNAEVVTLTAQLMILIAIYQFSDAIQGLSISMLRGLQDVKVVMPIVLCSYVVLNIPIGCYLAFGLGMECRGLVIGLIVGLSAAALLTSLRILYDVKRIAR